MNPGLVLQSLSSRFWSLDISANSKVLLVLGILNEIFVNHIILFLIFINKQS